MNSLHTTTKSSPRLPQLERARAQQQTPKASKNKERKKSTKNKQTNKQKQMGTFLVVQQLRFRLPVQGVQVRSLVVELRSHVPHKQETKT